MAVTATKFCVEMVSAWWFERKSIGPWQEEGGDGLRVIRDRRTKGLAGPRNAFIGSCAPLSWSLLPFYRGSHPRVQYVATISHLNCVCAEVWCLHSSGPYPYRQSLSNQNTSWRIEHISMISMTIHFAEYLAAIDWKTKTNGISDFRGESLPTFVKDGDTSSSTHCPTWIYVYFSRTVPLQWTH